MVETQVPQTFSSQEPSTFRMRAARALTAGAGKELAERFTHEAQADRSGVWAKDAEIRGYAIDGWKGMAEAVLANAAVGGSALALDQLEKKIVGDVLLKKTKEFIEHRHERPSDIASNVHWESPWVTVADNIEESGSDMLINAAAHKAVNAVVQSEKSIPYASPIAEVLADGVNLATFIFGKTTPVQRLGLTYAKIRNSVNASDTESVLRGLNLIPVAGALLEKYIYSPINHKLEHSKAVQFVTGWTMKSAVWYIIGMVTNGASERAATQNHAA